MPFSKGEVVTPEYLSRYEGGGSLSTLWYAGSDNEYHHFKHFVKTSTKYRISKNDLNWEAEFPLKSMPAVLVDGELKRYVASQTEQGN